MQAQCIASAASGVGCPLTDFACQCKPANNAAIQSAALPCVLKGCGPQTGLAVQGSASAVCACAATAGPAAPKTSTAAPASTTAVQATSPAVPAASSSPSIVAPYPTSSAAAMSPTAAAPVPSGTGSVSNGGTTFTGTGVKIIASISAAMVGILALFVAL